MNRAVLPRGAKPAVFVLCLIPFVWLLYRAFSNDLGANPIETLTRASGDWTLRFLLVTLAITPLRRLLNWPALLRLRRMLGLYAFFYVLLHFSIYILDWVNNVDSLLADIIKRPYITVGFTAFLMLWPLALTSTRAAQRRLGRRWQQLHRLAYAIPVLGVLHYWWLVKSDIREPLLYAVILAALLGLRLLWRRRA